MLTQAPTDVFPFPTIPIEPGKLIALTNSLIGVRLRYSLGCKIDPIDLQDYQLVDNGIGAVDCSGFVRWAIWHATAGAVIFEDGSVQQHDQIKRVGFKPSTVDAGSNHDNVVRIAFLAPAYDTSGVTEEHGHVLLLPGDGLTCESHGHKGPDRRVWNDLPFAHLMDVYVLSMPHSQAAGMP